MRAYTFTIEADGTCVVRKTVTVRANTFEEAQQEVGIKLADWTIEHWDGCEARSVNRESAKLEPVKIVEEPRCEEH